MPGPSARGGLRPACSAARCNSSSSTPAIPKLPASPPHSTCPTPPAFPIPPDPTAASRTSSPIPLSYHDAAPILQALKGPSVPQSWQGALPFHYHMGPGGEKVHLVSQQDYQRRIIWDVIGKIEGSQEPDAWVVVGNHRDAWVYGAVDPNSGTAAMLEAAHGIGALLRQGWRPQRTIVFCSWDAEEEGLIGSTEWVEQQGRTLDHAVAYFNIDVGGLGPGLHRLRRALAQGVRARHRAFRSQPARRLGVSAMAPQTRPRAVNIANRMRRPSSEKRCM